MHAFNKELRDSGALVATEGLTSPNEAKVVRAGSNGEPIIDGVFPESKEFLAGYWIVDVESPEQAYKIAARRNNCGDGTSSQRRLLKTGDFDEEIPKCG